MLKRLFKVFVIFVFVLVLCALSGCIKAEKKGVDGNEPVFLYGNTSGNHSNYGIAAMQDDWVCFTTDSGLNDYLCKISSTDKEKTILDQCDCDYINIVGDSIYYINRFNNRLTKIKTDGSSKTELLEKINFDKIFVVDDWIYYTDFDKPLSGLYRIRTDGKGEKKITSDFATDFFVLGNRVYYCRGSADGGLFSISTDGKDKIKIVDKGVSTVNAAGDWLYYIDNDYCIWKVQFDGQNKMKLVEGSAASVNAAANWIYYTRTSESNSLFLYRIRTDGTENTLLLNEDVKRFAVVGDWIYYTTEGESQWTYRVRTDGTEKYLP